MAEPITPALACRSLKVKLASMPTKISLRLWPRTFSAKWRMVWSMSSAVCPSKEGR